MFFPQHKEEHLIDNLKPRHIVIGATAHAALAERLRSLRPDLEVRGAPHTELTTDDLAWADTYVGFRRPPLPTMGNVRWVHCTGAGVDSWLYPTELPRDILLTRTSESFGTYLAEWALSRALALLVACQPTRANERSVPYSVWVRTSQDVLKRARV